MNVFVIKLIIFVYYVVMCKKKNKLNATVDTSILNQNYRDQCNKSILESKGNEKNINNAIAKVLSNDPMPLDKLEGSSVLQGPVLQSPKPIQALPERQRKLDQTLRKELNSLISRKYPHLRTTYG